MKVEFEVDDPRASRHGEVVTAEGDQLEIDSMNMSKLVLYRDGTQVTSFPPSSLRAVYEDEPRGGFGGMF